jgi:hypothetical protein
MIHHIKGSPRNTRQCVAILAAHWGGEWAYASGKGSEKAFALMTPESIHADATIVITWQPGGNPSGIYQANGSPSEAIVFASPFICECGPSNRKKLEKMNALIVTQQRVFAALRRMDGPSGPTEIGRAIGLDDSIVSRALAVLADQNMVKVVDDIAVTAGKVSGKKKGWVVA